MRAQPSYLHSKGDLAACLERMQRGVQFRSQVMLDQRQMPDYGQPMRDAIELFDELKIGYALIGGVAAMYYGRPRFTEDIDFVASSGHMAVLEKNVEAMLRHQFDPSSVWKLYHSTGVEIDIWKDEHADEVIARAKTIELAGHSVQIADPHDLIAMKLRAGRVRDDYDISEIIRGTEIDDEQLRNRVSPEEFARYQAIKQRR